MNHRNRTAAFVVGFCALAAHMSTATHSRAAWFALVLQFLVYPHGLYLRARRSPDPLRAEVAHTFSDAAVFGFWSAFLAFPLWVTFIFFVGATVNPGAFRGRRGLLQGVGAFAMGALPGAALGHFRIEPATTPLVTALCIASVMLYLVTVALGAHDRAVKLYDARGRLREKERALTQQLAHVRELEAQLREQAERDPLTGLYNRCYLEPALERELGRAVREGLPLTLMIVDVDHFKRINDTYGHPAGDAVLRELGGRLMAATTESDVVCRFGGEEFLLVLPELGAAEARERAERLRRSWESSAVVHGKHVVQSTLSIGISTYPGSADTTASLIKAADLALYEAKRTGRNRSLDYHVGFGSLGKPAPPFAPPSKPSEKAL